jgi:Domain of unknown function (DUF4337)
MASEELQELHEHAEHAKHDRSMAPVSLTMAILAVGVAVVSLVGHRAHTEEVLSQAKASDQWAYYQAKNIRRQNDQVVVDLVTIIPTQDTQAVAKLREKYASEAERYQFEQKGIQSEAQQLEQEVGVERRRADRFDLGEVFLEVALVITSITLLSGKRIFWHIGIVLAIVGFVTTATGVFTH